jgi:hypothetical protein
MDGLQTHATRGEHGAGNDAAQGRQNQGRGPPGKHDGERAKGCHHQHRNREIAQQRRAPEHQPRLLRLSGFRLKFAFCEPDFGPNNLLHVPDGVLKYLAEGTISGFRHDFSDPC